MQDLAEAKLLGLFDSIVEWSSVSVCANAGRLLALWEGQEFGHGGEDLFFRMLLWVRGWGGWV
jgi:hypothetical protein